MVEQLSFFETFEVQQDVEQVEALTDTEQLKKFALCFTVGEKGGNPQVHFMMSEEDAMKFCQDPRTKGVLRGFRWAYHWTSVFSYLDNAREFFDKDKRRILNLKKCKDNGKYDGIIDDLKCRKISLEEIPDVLEPYGVKVLI